MAQGTHADPITTDEPRQYKVCRCGACGLTERYTPAQDFYLTPLNDKLRCEPCMTKPLQDQARMDRIARN